MVLNGQNPKRKVEARKNKHDSLEDCYVQLDYFMEAMKMLQSQIQIKKG